MNRERLELSGDHGKKSDFDFGPWLLKGLSYKKEKVGLCKHFIVSWEVSESTF